MLGTTTAVEASALRGNGIHSSRRDDEEDRSNHGNSGNRSNREGGRDRSMMRTRRTTTTMVATINVGGPG